MPITKSAKKAAKQSLVKQRRNYATRTRYKDSIKKLNRAAKTETEGKNVQELLSKAYSEIDRAVKKKILHKNTAARRKANVAKAVNGKKA
ncbi:30S ribosomal protein S20 [Candidatus Peregrinibacteria bacterium RIFOXYC2_FULL_33_13]|nr:MAG: 30S ribosomal protein S20 [Candidatus Peregrinibacteria bacterium GW2011_GWA2_33_10]KKP41211.1 MAG: 30S ribosomal protein S20, small subunit ribosomal protein S20 [Candidatus Peregrinibacteria bacterium GW2011_GWC2_33_13]OGJ49331.1 MAG: 30S ribosomal protein S20 [Candidatus Peregrinibacteria bacterium RIFOXYA2_FULL_33_7]OGJ54199.1 MAG: 30S ribosomal protein S20 [Candidatus Peregrinibacteria bacterium RIFOXYC2_FULL_33_13]